MATTMGLAFNKAGIFVSSYKGDMVEAARKEMARARHAARLEALRKRIEYNPNLADLSADDLKFAVRYLGALRRGGKFTTRVFLPGTKGYGEVRSGR